MYEPKYLPQLKSTLPPVCGISFGIDHVDKFVDTRDPNKDPLHMHKQLEIFFNVDSDVSFLVNNHLYSVVPSSAVVSKANDIHVCMFNKSRIHSYYCIWIDGNFSSSLFSFLYREDYSPLFTFKADAFNRLVKQLEELNSLYQTGGSDLAKTSLLLSILSAFENNQHSPKDQPRLPRDFQAVLDDINRNFANMNSIGDIIKNHYMSQATLNRYFRKYINASPHEYLESQKLSYAAKLLSEGHSVTSACMLSGFSDCSRFIVLFKRKFSTTPRQYKLNLLSSRYNENRDT